MEDITVQELNKRIEDKETLIIIDVREDYEYDEYNIGAKLIPLADLLGDLEQIAEYKELEIIVHCRSGARSGKAKEIMLQNGFQKVRNLLGGMLAWQDNFE